MEIRDYISIDPNICHGKPCFKGTRLRVHLVLEMLEAGHSSSDIQHAYPPLTSEHVKAAMSCRRQRPNPAFS